MTTKTENSREIALDILFEILEKGSYSHLVLRQALNKYQYLEKQERAFITRLTDGTLEYLIQIDHILNTCSSVKVQKMKPVIRTILRMSVYQLVYMDRVPDSAVCNEAVKLAVKRKFQGLKGFVNGVLRSIARQKETITFPDEATRYAMPGWLYAMWEKDYGAETTRRICRAFLEEKPLMVRCNLDKASRAEILESLESQAVSVTENPDSDSVLCLAHYDYLESLTAFQRGWIQVQDLSSTLVGDIADPAPGAYVIDVCGAPGGKSLHIADKLRGSGTVEVRDVSPMKVSMIEDNIARTGFSNIHARVQDALVFDEASSEKADLVIADLPCSGLGIIGKKPDIKLRATPERLQSLAALQRDILSVVWRYVKPGGTLIYSTCTINRKENEENAAWFAESFPFKPLNLEGKLGENLTTETAADGCMQLLPGIHPCDGFFISGFRRI